MNLSTDKGVPSISVGLVKAQSITVSFLSGFTISGEHTFTIGPEGIILMDCIPASCLRFCSSADDSVFEVKDVVIGIGFHWERAETQRFTGDVEFVVEDGLLRLINRVNIEEYLKSVISSEMNAKASPALLKAHAVISRSWVLAQLQPRNRIAQSTVSNSPDEIIRWYDRDNHALFDVCADDHCQRYQGITRRTTGTVDSAVEATRGEVLTSDGDLCDARFSKCCGGAMELFSSCWDDRDYNYLQAIPDRPGSAFPDLRDHHNAHDWITSRPEAFCNTSDPDILSQVLNNYDRETSDFYRWKVNYDGAVLGELIKKKSGIDMGIITALIPLQRGPSGRIIKLHIEGTRRTVTVGKELEIRRWLSPTHLYSSAFVVDTDNSVYPARFTLRGAGWGHGVGLCQIGAAVMGAKGYSYRQILNHYYPGAVITKIYE